MYVLKGKLNDGGGGGEGRVDHLPQFFFSKQSFPEIIIWDLYNNYSDI